MIVSCPECETRFNLPGDALGAQGRKLRCGNCGHVWFQVSPDAEDGDDELGDAAAGGGNLDFDDLDFTEDDRLP